MDWTAGARHGSYAMALYDDGEQCRGRLVQFMAGVDMAGRGARDGF
jgi:hypothetical protein